MSWTLSDIRSKWRAITGRSTTGQIADASITTIVNDYYQYDFPVLLDLERLDGSWSQQLTVDDDGEYSVSEDYIELTLPIMLNGDVELRSFNDQAEFWRLYPSEEDTISAPTLVVGTTDAAHVRNSAFAYSIDGYYYSKAAAETALSGDAVPVNTYGAWVLTIDDDGDISITAASANSTGYATPGKAVEGISTSSITTAVLGFVTAICSAGAFTPGTTELNTGASVTATFTDGHPAKRHKPESILLTRNNGKVYVRPKPNDLFYITSQAVLQRPTVMSGDTDTPLDEAWGLAIAMGSAMKWLAGKEADNERQAELMYGSNGLGNMPGCLKYELALIRQKQAIQQQPSIERYW